LVTLPAVTALYQRLKLIFDELREIDLLYRLADEEGAKAVYRRTEFDPLERRRIRDIPIQPPEPRFVKKLANLWPRCRHFRMNPKLRRRWGTKIDPDSIRQPRCDLREESPLSRPIHPAKPEFDRFIAWVR
jgi:hypothetical protein